MCALFFPLIFIFISPNDEDSQDDAEQAHTTSPVNPAPWWSPVVNAGKKVLVCSGNDCRVQIQSPIYLL